MGFCALKKAFSPHMSACVTVLCHTNRRRLPSDWKEATNVLMFTAELSISTQKTAPRLSSLSQPLRKCCLSWSEGHLFVQTYSSPLFFQVCTQLQRFFCHCLRNICRLRRKNTVHQFCFRQHYKMLKTWKSLHMFTDTEGQCGEEKIIFHIENL